MTRGRVESPANLVQVTMERLLATGELLDQATFVERRGWTIQSLTSALRTHRLFRLNVGGVWAYPAFLADLRYDIDLVESVSELLGPVPAGAKWLFFTQAKGSLSIPSTLGQPEGVARTPLQAIEAGEFDLVKRAAVGFSQR